MKLSKIKLNPTNPRLIKDERFAKLVNSIKEFPKMMELRPIIIDKNNMILGGNMRFKALKELEYKDIPDEWIKRAEDLTEEETKRFIIADNVAFGEHDWDILKDWNIEELEAWGVDIPKWKEEKEITDLSDNIQTSFKIEIDLDNEEQQEKLYNEFLERGIKCRLLTL